MSEVSKSEDPSPQSLSQRESVCGITRFIETAGDVFVAFTQMEDENIQRVADGLGVEAFVRGRHADVEEDVVIAADRVFHDGMLPIQLVQERDEGLSGRALRRGAEVDADQGVHAVVRDDGADQAVLARRQCGHEDDGVVDSNASALRFLLKLPFVGNGIVLSAMREPFCTMCGENFNVPLL